MWYKPTSDTTVTSPFGRRKAPIPGATTMHAGTDFRAPTGRLVRSVGPGKVTRVDFHTARGHYVVILHDDGTETLYQHLSTTEVKTGQRVKGNQRIGKAGATGLVKGAHLHLEARTAARDKGGQLIDPIVYLSERGVAPWGTPKPTPKPKPKPKSNKSRELERGDTGAAVRELQRVLDAWYPWKRPRLLDVEAGTFGPQTVRRVQYLQQRGRLKVTGRADVATLRLLNIIKS